MPEERRSARRARIPGVRVTYESASGDVNEAEVVNLSRDGIFIPSPRPLAIGKRLSLELLVAGEPGGWAALGRVIWVRTVVEGDDLPPGMGVKIIDIEESVAVAIDRLIEARERTEPGLGAGGRPAGEKPLREKTMIGVGTALPGAQAAAPAEAAPVAAASPTAPAPRALPSREKTVLGVGRDAAGVDPRDASVAIDLVAKKPASTRPPPAWDEPAPAPATSRSASEVRESDETADRRLREFEKAAGPVDEGPPSEAPAPRRRSRLGWWVLFVIVAAMGAAAYVFRERLPSLWQSVMTDVLKRVR